MTRSCRTVTETSLESVGPGWVRMAVANSRMRPRLFLACCSPHREHLDGESLPRLQPWKRLST